MRPDRTSVAAGNDDVRVSALQPRPLLKHTSGETAALPPVGRPPRKAYGRAAAWAAAALVATAVVARLGFEQWDRTTLHSGGPLLASAGINGQPLPVGEPTAFRGLVLRNRATKPAVVEKFRLLGVTGGFEVLDVHAVPVPSSNAAKTVGSPVVPAATRTKAGQAEGRLPIVIRVRATVPGVARARGVEVIYRVGHRRYRRSDDSPMYLCAPREQFPGFTCPGEAEGRFSDVVIDVTIAP
jgi:hypothetical protein